jgi:iron complex outermembrane receptor protein
MDRPDMGRIDMNTVIARRFFLSTVSLLVCTAEATLADAQAIAQPPVAGPPPSSSATPSSTGLGDIIVTAQRRAERLQNVPIAVTAVSSAALVNRGIATTQELQLATPTLVYTTTGQYAVPFLRGIGTDVVVPSSDASVATYIDGVYVANQVAGIVSLLGVDRVEVLEGPQGTLYGRNAVAGAINVITLTPSQQFEAAASGTYGNYDHFEGTARVSGEVAPNLFAGVYAAGSSRDSYLTLLHPAPVSGEPSRETNWGVRGKLIWQPSDIFHATALYEHGQSRGIEGPAFRNGQDNAVGFAFGGQAPDEHYVVETDAAVYNRTKSDSGYIRLETFLEPFSIVSTTGLRHFTNIAEDDIDATSANLVTQGVVPIISKQFSQEVQLQSPSGSPVSWILGGYYFHEHAGYDPLFTRFGPLLGQPVDSQTTTALTNTNSFAAFGQATIPITAIAEGMKLTLGGRYTIDRKSFDAQDQFFVGQFDAGGTPAGGPILYPSGHKTWKQFTPKITLDYKIGGTLLYASYSKGFKSGTYNLSTPSSPGPVDPEKLDAYEVGIKSDMLGGKVRLNAAGYFYNFKDIQVQILSANGAGGGLTASLQNAASARTYGLEGTLTGRISHDLTASFNAAWAHGTYTKFPGYAFYVPTLGGVGNTSVSVDASGNRIQRLPTWLFGASADYSRNIGFGKLHLSVAWRHNSGFYWDAAEYAKQRAFDVVNGSAGVSFAQDRLDVSVWAHNLTNTYYLNGSTPTPFGRLLSEAEPRMYGVTMSVKY